MSTKRSAKRLFLAVMFTCLSSIGAYAQNKPENVKAIWEDVTLSDSLRFNALHRFYEHNTFAQPDYVLQLTEYHLQLAAEKQNDKEKVNALSERSFAFFTKDNIQKAEENLEDAIQIQITLDDKVSLARLYANLASVYREQGKFIETIRQYNYSLKIFEEAKEEKSEAAVLGNLGLVFFDIKNNEIALDYFERAREKYKKLNLHDKVGYVSLNIGAIDFEKKDYSQSIKNAEKALTLFEENNNLLAIIDCYILLAKSLQKSNQTDQALAYIHKSLEASQQLGNTSKVIENKILMAELYVESDIHKATQIGEEALAMLDANSDKKTKASLYNLLYKCYKGTQKMELSHNMYDQYVVYNDSIVKEQSNLELIKEAVNQEFKIKLLETQKSFEQSEKELKRSQIIKLSVTVFVFVLLVSSIFFYFRRRIHSDRKRREELVEEIEKLKKSGTFMISGATETFQLDRVKIETAIQRRLNETDWNVLNVLSRNPVISNKEIATQVFMSVDGIGSALRRMYDYFEIEESKYKKTDLIRKAIQISTDS
ncbi:MAG: tetratricopeptide repeat protein [Bacteroidia bacterium]|nr:tetratricopeptide repeat protein [Bacteroidia bacterium]